VTHLKTTALALLLLLAAGVTAAAQQPPSGPPPDSASYESLKVQVVLSRFQGEKKVSSLPYTLTVTTQKRTSLRMGAQVPVATLADKASTNFTYKDVGTSIDCSALALKGGRYVLEISIEDSSVYPDDARGAASTPLGNPPSFRSFRSSESIVLADGQSGQFTTATDKVTGEVVKVDVTLTVLK
jgi:hypothetical protein